MTLRGRVVIDVRHRIDGLEIDGKTPLNCGVVRHRIDGLEKAAT